jgi:hypothetical protein
MQAKTDEKQYKTPDKFDRMMGSLDRVPTVAKSKAATVSAVTPLIGEVQTFIIQTYRQPPDDEGGKAGDFIFVQYMDADTHVRLCLPPGAADAIARQRDALTTKNRKRAAKLQAQQRKARGEVPGFMRKKK